ncbi:MAG: ABC transporter substrate-binding protein [Rhodospirillales bacterium]
MYFSRRGILAGGFATVLAGVAGPGFALSEGQARGLIEGMVSEINRVIGSGRSPGAMYGDFERIFKKYGDTRVIAAYAMGVDGRRASGAQKKAFTEAFTGYIARKYGKRFREFEGGRLEVQSVGRIKNGFEVKSTAFLRSMAPFTVTFHVSQNNRFFNMYVEGVNMLLTERSEIGAMLDRRRGDIDAMIADLRKAG